MRYELIGSVDICVEAVEISGRATVVRLSVTDQDGRVERAAVPVGEHWGFDIEAPFKGTTRVCRPTEEAEVEESSTS